MSLARIYSWEGRHAVGDHIRAARRVRLLERALSRRQVMKTIAGASGAVLGAGMVLPTLTRAADGADPKPIPTGIQPLGPGTEIFHLYLPEAGNELSTITDFNGVIAAAEVQGTGTGTNASGAKMPLLFDVDARLMQGQYVGMDGQVRTGAFALI
jgi:hypothetical protein